MMLRIIRLCSIALIALVLAGWATVWLGRRDPDGPAGHALAMLQRAAGVTSPRPGIGGPFTLTDQSGRTVTAADYRGHFMLVYFGYTYCPDVCPTELQTIAATLDRLGPEAERITPIFITVDPQRDTPSVLRDYVKLFYPRLVGLTGTPDQIKAVTSAYRVYYARADGKDDKTYLMDHSSFVYLMGPDGQFRTLFRPGMAPEEMAASITEQIRQSS